MTRRARWGLAVLVLGGLLCPVGARGTPREDRTETYSETIAPLLVTYCVRCHAGPTPMGALDLELLRPAPPGEGELDLSAHASTLRRIRERLARHEMPPAGFPRPPAEVVTRAVAWLDARLPAPELAPAPIPRRVTMRRLARLEYANTIRDLLGVTLRVEERLPADDVGYGFDNIGDVLSLPPILLEKYLLAAEDIAARAIVDELPTPDRVHRYKGTSLQLAAGGNATLRGSGPWALTSTAEVFATHEFPRDGTYLLGVVAFGQQAGPDPARMAIRIDGRSVRTADVKAEIGSPERYEIRVPIPAGRHRVGAAFINDYYRPDAKDPRQRDRNLFVLHVEIGGPLDAPVLPPFQRKLLPQPVSEVAEADREAYFRDAVRRVARRAWRRPVAEEDLDRLVALGNEAGERASLEARFRTVLVALLVSPRFLFRAEPAPLGGDADAARPLDDHELASRLSYFLWGSMPDDELRAQADAGRLADEAELDRQVRRMQRDARASNLAHHFAVQWLKIGSLSRATPDPDRFPGVDGALLEAMHAETELFFEALWREDRDVRELLRSDFTFVNEALARHYGLPPVHGPAMRRVSLPDDRRGGVLTHASVLTATSNPTRTSPVQRGKWVLETLLDAAPPPPPPGVGALDEAALTTSASLRERLALHRADPTCAVCHDLMDPLGLSLENYDAVGRWREVEGDGETAVDSSGRLPDGRTIEGAAALADVVATDTAFLRAIAKNLLTYALGRGIEADESATVQRLVRALEAEPTLPNLAREIVKLDVFRRRPPHEGDPE